MPTVRNGKTAKDRANKATERRLANQAARREWQNDNRSTNANFPYDSCNGKKNRYVVTGKGGQPVNANQRRHHAS